jgi:hypothetical protein
MKKQKNARHAMALANCPATQTQMTFQPALPATALALFWMISDLAQLKSSQIKHSANDSRISINILDNTAQ